MARTPPGRGPWASRQRRLPKPARSAVAPRRTMARTRPPGRVTVASWGRAKCQRKQTGWPRSATAEARRAATVSGSASPTDISTQATFAVEISATAATTSTSVDRGLIKCASSFTDNEKGPGPVSLGLISVLLCCRLLRQLPSRSNQTSFSRDIRNVPHTQVGLLNRANSVTQCPVNPATPGTYPPRRGGPALTREHPLKRKEGPLLRALRRLGDSATP